MILLPPIPHRLTTKGEIAVGLAFLIISLQLLLQHVMRVQQMRDIGLPSAMQLPVIEERMAILKQQSEAMQLQASVNGGSSEEALQAYVLPKESRTDRLLSALDVVTTTLKSRTQLKNMSAIHVGDSADSVTPISFEVDVTKEGLDTLLSVLNTSGLLTVNDALSDRDRKTLIALTEQENPAAVTALESFLATDLLSYSKEPKPFEDQLLKSFSSDSFTQSFRAIIGGSKLPAIQRSLSSDIGRTLEQQKLWPMQFLRVSHVKVTDVGGGWMHVGVGVEGVGRIPSPRGEG